MDDKPVGTRPWLLPFLVCVLVALIVDLVSKEIAFSIPATDPTFVDGFVVERGWFELRHDYNKGVAWSMGSSMQWLVASMTLVIVPLVFVFYYRAYRAKHVLIDVSFGLILGGALGNGWDRLAAYFFGMYDGVRDFISIDVGLPFFDPFPTFNVADSCITIGFAMLIIQHLLFRGGEVRTDESPAPNDQGVR